MHASVFEFECYKKYLETRLSGKGRKAEFSQRIGCQPSFLSQVLRGKPSLSLEQGVLANDYFQHSTAEGRHFLSLLQFERAGSTRLRAHFQTELKASLAEQRKLAQRVGPARELSDSARATYYSSWIYGAIHVLASIPESGDQREILCRRAGLTPAELDKVMRFLKAHGLMNIEGGRATPTQARIHLPATDPQVLNHHRNFRARSLQEVQQPKEDSLHYSLLMAISRADGLRIRDLILRLVENTDKIIRPSPEETAFQLNFDFFEV
jgi:uncharacterized protein (TIGR02147 family)